MKYHFEGFPSTAHPMAILSSMINASGCFYPGLLQRAGRDEFDIHAARLISQVRTIAAFSYRKSHGLPIIYPKPTYKYTANFLHMLFSDMYEDYELRPEVVHALDLIFLLHADHEQNCSTSTVRMVASARPTCSPARRGRVRAVGTAARWRQPGRHRDAHRHPQFGRQRLALHRRGQGKGQRQEADGLRPPRVQELRPARPHHQEGVRQPARGAQDRRPAARHRQAHGRGRPVRRLLRRAQAVPQRGFLQRHHHARPQHPDRDVHGRLRHRPHAGLDRPFQGDPGRPQERASTARARSTWARRSTTTSPSTSAGWVSHA
jgi:hypothetical protein